jgi:hypothetical protein
MIQKEKAQFPSYRELFKQIKNQLYERGGMTAKRSLLIGWPALIIVGIFSFIKNYDKNTDYVFYVMPLIPLALIYMTAMMNIFSTERLIWIDSYKNKKEQDEKDSFKIAKKLFWPSFFMRLQLFFRYYFLPLFLYFFICYLLFKFSLSGQLGEMGFLYFLGFFIVAGPIILWFYFKFINIKLRYIWFIFLDNYGKNKSYHDLFKEMHELNEINKSEAFRKSLAVDIGADFLQNLTSAAAGFSLKKIFGSFGKGGKVFGDITSAYASDVAAQMANLSKLAANYVLYCYSVEQAYKVSQTSNENIYSLLETSNQNVSKNSHGLSWIVLNITYREILSVIPLYLGVLLLMFVLIIIEIKFKISIVSDFIDKSKTDQLSSKVVMIADQIMGLAAISVSYIGVKRGCKYVSGKAIIEETDYKKIGYLVAIIPILVSLYATHLLVGAICLGIFRTPYLMNKWLAQYKPEQNKA